MPIRDRDRKPHLYNQPSLKNLEKVTENNNSGSLDITVIKLSFFN